jgi:hypothetical protein
MDAPFLDAEWLTNRILGRVFIEGCANDARRDALNADQQHGHLEREPRSLLISYSQAVDHASWWLSSKLVGVVGVTGAGFVPENTVLS